VLNKSKKIQPDKPFMNLSVEEMSARIQARDQELNRRNCLVLTLLLIAFGLLLLVGAWFYGAWMVETIGALRQLSVLLWNLEWWAAGQILLHYKLSFFVLGIFVGFFLFLFITFQIGEMLFDLIWDWISSFFN